MPSYSAKRWLAGLFPGEADLRMHGATARALTNSGWLMLERLVRGVLGVLVGVWVAGYLGPESFGALAYVLALVAFFQAIANAGADAIVVRDISRGAESAPQLLGSVLVLRLVLGALAWLGAVAAAAAVSAGDRQVILLTAVVSLTLIFQAADVVDLWFQSESQSRRTVAARLVVALASAALKAAMILSGSSLMSFAVVIAFESLMSAAAMAVAYRRHKTRGRWQPAFTTIRILLAESWPVMASGLLIMVYTRVDQLLIRHILGPRDLGIYAALLPISQFWQVLPLTTALSLAPFVARQKSGDKNAFERTLVLTFRGFFYCGVVAAGATCATSGVVVHLLLGQSYADGIAVINVHSLSNAFCFLGIAHTLWLTGSGRLRVRLYGTVAAGVAALVVNLLVLPRAGLMGAAYAAILAQFTAAFLINALVDREGFRMQIEAITFWRPSTRA